MELLIVMTIIAILAAAIIPNFIGFDAEAKVAATKSNLDTLRSRVTLFRAKEGRYPSSLQELVEKSYMDAGVKRPYLKSLPLEMVSSRKGSSAAITRTSEEGLTDSGGWLYVSDTAEIRINASNALDKGWGEYAGQNPSDW
jgi:type II secretory pathway pseudopilin PulG